MRRPWGGMYVVCAPLGFGPPELDVFSGEGLDLAGRVDEARPGRAGANIDPDEVILGVL